MALKARTASPEAQVFFESAQASLAQGDKLKAVHYLTEALKKDSTFADAYAETGNLALQAGQIYQAIEAYAQAVAYDPRNKRSKQKLIDVCSSMTYKKMNPNLKGVLIECLEDRDIYVFGFRLAWLSILKSDKSFLTLYKLSKDKDYKNFKKAIQRIKSLDPLMDPFFLTGLIRFNVPDIEFENWITNLRRFALELWADGKHLFQDEEKLEFIYAALSNYAYLAEYVFAESQEESKHVDALKALVEKDNKPKLSVLMLLGCYRSIHDLKNARAILDNLPDIKNHVSQIPRDQLSVHFEQKKIKPNIQTLTNITDLISVSVQGQYEEFPYPRWDTIHKHIENHPIVGQFEGKKIKVLAAGCGTGQEALEHAYLLSAADFLAVDLSKASLTYATMRAEHLGIKNVTFKQGDIMNLGALDDKFDYITSSGVLHHMKDPKAGWQVLTNLLKPGGLMLIGLYSKTARRYVNETRKAIADHKIGSDAKSIVEFRHNIQNYLNAKSAKEIVKYGDYFTLNMCRDLLFHVHEHQFDWTEIKAILQELGLELKAIKINKTVIDKYKLFNPYDPQATDLDGWFEYEKRNPDTFLGMYSFWCQKKA